MKEITITSIYVLSPLSTRFSAVGSLSPYLPVRPLRKVLVPLWLRCQSYGTDGPSLEEGPNNNLGFWTKNTAHWDDFIEAPTSRDPPFSIIGHLYGRPPPYTDP